MIVGVGTDVCDLRRIAATLERRGDRFAEKVLGPREWEVFQARRSVALRGLRYLGTRFAAKEAFSKAIGLGMRWPMTWRACEVLNAPSGRPEVVLSGELGLWFARQGWTAHVSLTDESDYASAFVVVERAALACAQSGDESSRPRHP
jgi:holo-[acyl-carrier protein] synthase